MSTLSQAIKDKLVIQGAAVGLDGHNLPGLQFDITKAYRFCRICGVVFQTEADRHAKTPLQLALVDARHKEWSLNHAKTHTNHQHNELKLSGLYALPHAAHKLASFGIFSIVDMVQNLEVEGALRESKAIPTDDAQS